MTDPAVAGQSVPEPRARRATSFDRAPRLVFWETTKACPLACVHCRAVAQRDPASDELSTEEGKAIIDELAGVPGPTPVLILTGGDCLQRRDLGELTGVRAELGRAGRHLALGLPQPEPRTLSMLHANGVRTASLSLDGAVAETHDQVRQVPGHFADTIRAIGLLKEHGFEVQVNSAVMAQNVQGAGGP